MSDVCLGWSESGMCLTEAMGNYIFIRTGQYRGIEQS